MIWARKREPQEQDLVGQTGLTWRRTRSGLMDFSSDFRLLRALYGYIAELWCRISFSMGLGALRLNSASSLIAGM